jgi:hypothetical protein
MSVSEKETVCLSKFNSPTVINNGIATYPPGSPTPQTKEFWPYSSIGLSIGIRYAFGKHFITDKARCNLN